MTTITLPRAVVEQALEALKDDQYRQVATAEGHWEYKTDLAIAALEAALAQQAEPVEPVAWECKAGGLKALTQRQYDAQPPNIRRHYTRIAPPQRKPLSDEKISDLWCEVSNTDFVTADTHEFARAVERAHGITDPRVEDRLARHGIPMPEGNPK